ncbi:response regulator transcription factor [Novosphingobium jiangmenense]|uniref:Response regulator transcription factor n=1 Tax=Novosphingobium jiangmenense TaxID=2791981 RepID=A0ABS0HLD9_9SPHN|nr:response regulator [Novosphingobium jiangmenense]MBF9153061.1 response regulator transcription factor [Novosphingobium jiangmenense]
MSIRSGEKVYVVDDDEPTRASIDSILRSVGYSVETLSSGEELLERITPGIEGCVVLDVRLPGPSGLEVQKRLNENGIDVPLIFITGHGDIAMAVQAMKAKAVEFLTKPFREQDLLDGISRALDLSREQRRVSEAQKASILLVKNLSSREFDVFSLLCQGYLGKQIAHLLELSEATVKVHRRNLMIKLGVSSISQMILTFGHLADARVVDSLSDRFTPSTRTLIGAEGLEIAMGER